MAKVFVFAFLHTRSVSYNSHTRMKRLSDSSNASSSSASGREEQQQQQQRRRSLTTPSPDIEIMASTFHSPDASTPYSNPSRRSLVLFLDQQRREQSEKHHDTFVGQHQSLSSPSDEEETRGNKKKIKEDTSFLWLPSEEVLEETPFRPCAGGSSPTYHPQFRLRPTASYDEYMTHYRCHVCGGGISSITSFVSTPISQSFVPLPLSCTCHEATPQQQRLSTVQQHVSAAESSLSDARQQQHGGLVRNLGANAASLQLWLDDESDDEDDNKNNNNAETAFRNTFLLRPKALHRCHSDPVHHPYVMFTTTDTPQQPSPTQPKLQRDEDAIASLPPPLLHASSQSSATTSPAEERYDGHHVHTNITTSTAASDALATTSTTVAASAPLLPTMETPELKRPVKRNMRLLQKPADSQPNQEQDDDNAITLLPPPLLHASTQSSTSTSSAEERHDDCVSNTSITTAADAIATTSSTGTTSISSLSSSRPTTTVAATAAPLLPTMATPELNRPVIRNIHLVQKPNNNHLLLQEGLASLTLLPSITTASSSSSSNTDQANNQVQEQASKLVG